MFQCVAGYIFAAGSRQGRCVVQVSCLGDKKEIKKLYMYIKRFFLQQRVYTRRDRCQRVRVTTAKTIAATAVNLRRHDRFRKSRQIATAKRGRVYCRVPITVGDTHWTFIAVTRALLNAYYTRVQCGCTCTGILLPSRSETCESPRNRNRARFVFVV